MENKQMSSTLDRVNEATNQDSQQAQPGPQTVLASPPPPPKPVRWKPPSRKRKKVAKKPKVDPPAEENSKDVGVGSNRKSWVGKHFKEFIVDECYKASCKYCGQEYAAHPKLHGTDNLANHLHFQCKKYPYKPVDAKQKTLFFETREGGSSSLTSMSYSKEECRLKLVKMIILDELPFKIVEGDGFKELVASLAPQFKIPSRMTIARDCLKLYGDEKEKLKKLIKSQRVCLTTDTWTSIQNVNYMCLTAHWIDDEWRIQKRILSFCVIPNHKGKTIGKMIEECMLEWKVEKLLTVTVDNASSNDGAITYLKNKTKGWKTTILEHEFLHLRCCAHILNLIVKDGLKHQNESILRIRKGVRYVRSSPSRLQAFENCASKEKIESKSSVCLDIETRWNSTYLMLESAIKFEKAFERLREDDESYKMYFALGDTDFNVDGDGDSVMVEDEVENEGTCGGKSKVVKNIGPPCERDWKVAKSFLKFLKLFFDVTKKFSGSLQVTSNMFFEELVRIHTRLNMMSISKDSNVSLMATKMRMKFSKYWENLDRLNFLLYVAAILDPRYKMRFIEFCHGQVYENNKKMYEVFEKKVKQVMNSLFESYQRFEPSQSDSVSPMSLSQTPIDVDDMDDDDEGDLASQFAKHLEEDECSKSKSELARYLDETCERNVKSFDVLTWWKENSKRLPILSKIARDVFAIPVSTVSSESAFSTSGRILDPHRSSLNPEMVEALICCQNWLRSTPFTIDICELMKEVPLDDVEKYEEVIGEFRALGASNSKQVMDG